MNVMENEIILRLIYLVLIGLIGFLLYRVISSRSGMHDKKDDFLLLVKGQRNGEYHMSFSANDEITTEIAEKIIEKVVLDAGKKDPTIVRLLFMGSLKALTEDESVGVQFKDITGKDLKDQFNH